MSIKWILENQDKTILIVEGQPDDTALPVTGAPLEHGVACYKVTDIHNGGGGVTPEVTAVWVEGSTSVISGGDFPKQVNTEAPRRPARRI